MSQHDDVSYSRDGVPYADEGEIGCLQKLLSSKPIRSKPVTVEHGGESVTVVYRELSNDLKQKIMTHAIQHVEDQRRTQEEGGKGEWRDAESDRDVLIGEERDLRMLQAAMLDPETNGLACDLKWLRLRMGTQLQMKLGEHYAAFEASIDPAQVDEDTIKQVLQDVRDNYPFDYLLMQYDSITLVRSLQYSVSLLWPSQTDKSSGLESGEMQP